MQIIEAQMYIIKSHGHHKSSNDFIISALFLLSSIIVLSSKGWHASLIFKTYKAIHNFRAQNFSSISYLIIISYILRIGRILISTDIKYIN